MSERREPGFNLDPIQDSVPTLETPVSRPSAASHPVAPTQAKSSSVATVLLSLLVFISLGAAVALGLWGTQLKQQMAEQQILIEQMNLWLESTDATLTQTSTTASRSGETLMGRVEDIGTRLDERVNHFDSEIAKLWTIAYQRNKPQLEEQGKTLAAQAETLAAQDTKLAEALASLSVLRTEIESQVKQLATLSAEQADVKRQASLSDERIKSQSARTDALASNIDKLDASIATVEGQALQIGSDMEFQFSVERDERAKLTADLNRKLEQQSQSQSVATDLERRLGTIEDRLKAIDASRTALNTELLKVQGQVNGLMLDRSSR